MTRDEIEKKYKGHPLELTLKAFEEETKIGNFHRYFIAAKTVIAVLEYQGELSRDQSDSLRQYVDMVTDRKLGNWRAPN